MDAQKYAKKPISGSLAPQTKGKILAGAKRIRKGIQRGEVCRVFLAENADPGLTEPLEELCRVARIPVSWVNSMSELGNRCGIEVAASAAAVLR